MNASRPHRLLRNNDALAVFALIALWLLFFWRLFTPIEADQASLRQGDFSGQFVAFAAYQYQRFSQGEIPLWNPYNNGGLPFIADTQAAVFYPPRLLALALTRLLGGFSYRTLEWEMTGHVLLYTLLMYAFVRRLTWRQRGTFVASLIAALTSGYGGFFTGYAPLQLAILEAGTWLPLGLLGILSALPPAESDKRSLHIHWMSLVLAGFALGISWMAGHPQTSFFMTWLMVAYLAYRVYDQRRSWHVFVLGTALLGGTTLCLAAVQLFPGFEYLSLTTRSGFGFDAKGNGFPIQDIIQFVFPHVVSLFSPLYIGVAGLFLAATALTGKTREAVFWGFAALVALLWSFGANSLLYPLLYNLLPGAYFFRGQERAAFVVSVAGSILAGLGAVRLILWQQTAPDSSLSRHQRHLWIAAAMVAGVSMLIFIAWLGDRDAYGGYISYAALSALVALSAAWLLPRLPRHPTYHLALAGLIVFELFTVNMDYAAVYDRVPPAAQLSLTPPPLVEQVLADETPGFRVDGFRGLGDNYGSLYGVADIRGISPLWLGSAFAIIEGDLPVERAWELFAVRYVFTDWNELPIPSTIAGRGSDRFGAINLHQIADPRPFVLPIEAFEIIPDDRDARERLGDPAFDARRVVILNAAPDRVPDIPQNYRIRTEMLSPELWEIVISSDAPALLSISLVDYPGWSAMLNGEPIPILRAYGALMAVTLQPGEDQTLRLTYDPLSYRVGALLSLVSWASVAILGFWNLFRRRRR